MMTITCFQFFMIINEVLLLFVLGQVEGEDEAVTVEVGREGQLEGALGGVRDDVKDVVRVFEKVKGCGADRKVQQGVCCRD